jgi:hypothetical protein
MKIRNIIIETISNSVSHFAVTPFNACARSSPAWERRKTAPFQALFVEAFAGQLHGVKVEA